MIKLPKFLQKPKRKIELKEIYTDTYKNKYYEYKDLRQLPGCRLRVSQLAIVEAELSLTAEKGSMLVDKWIEFANKNDFVQAGAIAVELKRRFVALAEEETLLKLASCYFVMNDEDESLYNASDQVKKFDAWSMDDKARDFFLSAAIKITEFYGNTSIGDILTYLKKNQPDMEKAQKFLEKF